MWSTSAILTSLLAWLAIGSVHETSPSSLFIACSSSTGQHVCATDPPDRVESSILHPASGQCIPDYAVCGWKCRSDPRCVEFDVWSSNRTCELYYSPPTAYLLTPECVHFQNASLVKCQPTGSNPCQFGGSCVPVCNGYICRCPAGVTGVNCETNIDECSINPCQNGGTCLDHINYYSCSCSPRFYGVTCQSTYCTWTVYHDQNVYASTPPYPDGTPFQQCQSLCIQSYPTCSGIDWDYGVDCYPITPAEINLLVPWVGIDVYALVCPW